jgi:acetoin utilization protein AcuB
MMLTANDLMTLSPQTIHPDAPLREAVALMNDESNRQLPVVANYILVGILTDRDVRLMVNSPLTADDPVDRIRLLDTYTVVDCMTRDPVTIAPVTPIYRVAQLLSIYKFGAFPVVQDNVLVGIITVTDLLNHLALQPVS